MPSEFRTGPDLNDPAQVAAELESIAGGLRQQATASDSRSATGGHPDPRFFFNNSAAILEAAAGLLRNPATPTEAPAVEETLPPASTTEQPKRGPGRPPKNPEPVSV